MTELNILNHIYTQYGDMIDVSATRWRHRPEVLAGIMCRESAGGLTLGPDGRGDNGHGHGLMQLDDRSYKEFCESEDWRVPELNIDYGARVLEEKRKALQPRVPTFDLDAEQLERASIAAYNCGAGRVIQALYSGLDVDSYTTHKDYSREVLRMAEVYRNIAKDESMKTISKESAPEKETLLSRLALMFMRLFRSRS